MPSRTCGTMTISLPTAMLAKIEHARQAEDRTRSEFVRQAIRVYLAHGATTDGALADVNSRASGAAGALADDDELREERKPDQTDGRTGDAAAGRVIDKVRDAVRDGKDRI